MSPGEERRLEQALHLFEVRVVSRLVALETKLETAMKLEGRVAALEGSRRLSFRDIGALLAAGGVATALVARIAS